MLDWILQSQLLAQNDGEEWINILFIVVLAVFWLVGGLVKAAGARRNAARKPQERREPVDPERRETWQQRLARKAEEVQRAAEEHIRKMQEQSEPGEETPERRRTDQGRVTVQTRRGGEPVLVYERQNEGETPEQRQQRAARLHRARQETARRREAQRLRAAERNLEAELPQIEPGLGSMTDVSLGASSRPRPLTVDKSMPQRPQQASYAESIIDYSDVDALSKAILHYEILGKPVALRDQSENAAGF
jgi:hypothetical protein